MTFGEKVKLARTTLNLSQTELAEITGISERSLYTYEQLNTIPRKSNVQKLADALHVTVTYLLDEEESDTQKDIDQESFILKVKNSYGNKSAHDAQEVLEKAGALFAGGDLDDDAKDIFMQSLMEVYISSREKAREKFTPKSKRKAKAKK